MIRGAAPTDTSPGVESSPGERLRHRQQRRRLVREELLVVAILLLVLAATVTVLAAQWLNSGSSTTGVGAPTTRLILGGHT